MKNIFLKMSVHFTTVEKAIKTFMYDEEKLPFEGKYT